MTKEWYSAQESADLHGMSKRGFIKMAGRNGYKTRQRAGKGGGLEYHINSFPTDVRFSLLPLESAAILAETPPPAPKPPKTRELAPVEDPAALAAARAEGDAQAAQLQGNAKSRMDARLEILREFDRFCAENRIKGTRKTGGTLQKEAFAAAWNRGDIASPARTVFPIISRNKIDHWTEHLRRAGLARLAGRYGHRKGSGLIDSQPQLAVALRALLCAKPHVRAKHAAEFLAARYADSGFQLPCIRTVDRWIDGWKRENHEMFARLENPDRWKSRYESAVGDADAHIVRPNQEWQADSTPADLMLADGRHSLLFLIDIYTRRLKIHVSKTSTATAIASLLRRGLLDWGVPEVLKTDNGQDYVARHIQNILLSLEIKHQRCVPFQANGKGFVERVIRTFSHDLLELLPGYVGHSVAERQALREREQFADRLYVKNKIDLDRLTVAELQSFCDRWARTYENAPHGGIDGQRPIERIANWREPTRRINDERALDLLLAPAPGKDGWRTLQKAGGITIDGHEYLSDVFGLHIKDRVRVLYDPEGDMGRVYVFDAKGQFLCVAECPELTGIDRAEHAARQKAIQKQNIQALAAQAKAEAKTFDFRAAALDILRDREQNAPLAALPGPGIEHVTRHLRGAADALTGKTALSGGEITPEDLRAAWGDIPAESESEPPKLAAPVVQLRDFESQDEGMRAAVERTLGSNQPITQEDADYIADYYRDVRNCRIFENSMVKRYGFQRFHAWKNAALAKARANAANRSEEIHHAI